MACLKLSKLVNVMKKDDKNYHNLKMESDTNETSNFMIILAIGAKVCASLLGQAGNVILKIRDDINDEREHKGEDRLPFCHYLIGFCNYS